MRHLPASAFNQTITVRPSAYPGTVQGGQNPAPIIPGTTYRASVQPVKSIAVDETAGGVGTPRSATTYNVFVDYDPTDTVLPALLFGDEIDWGSRVLVVQGSAENEGGQSIVWLIECINYS